MGSSFAAEGYTIYHAGDTALYGDMRLIGDEGPDVAIVPIGDVFTMGVDDSIAAIKLLRPKSVITDALQYLPAHRAGCGGLGCQS